MNDIFFRGKSLSVNSKEVNFDYEIDNILLINEMVVVLVDIPSNNYTVDNIYGVIKGEIVWQIQNATELYPQFSQTPYVGISIIDDKAVLATDFSGCRFIINSIDGKIIGRASSVK